MYDYTEEQFNNKVNKAILRYGLNRLTPQSHPSFVVVAGQAGAGKSSTKARVMRDNPDVTYIVDTDELRRFHPQYGRIQFEQGINSAEYTHEFASRLKTRIVEYLRERNVTFGLEATLSNPDSDVKLCQEFKQAGYETQVHIVTVPKEISSIGVTSRYFHGRNQTETTRDGYTIHKGRYVPGHIQQSQYENLPQSLERLVATKSIDYVGVYDRDGKPLYTARDNNINPDKAIETIKENRKLENTSTRQLETALENHTYNQTQNKHIQSQPAHTHAEQSEQKIIAADMRKELTYIKDVEKALPKAKKKERQEKRDERLKKRTEENKNKNQSQNRDKIRDKDIQDRGRTR